MSTLHTTATDRSGFFVVGGTLRRDAPSYVPRRADAELHDALAAGRFCYVLTSRQMGKSSLMVRTAARLREEGHAVAVLDLTAVGQNLTAEQWYKGLLGAVGEDLDLDDELRDAWRAHANLGPLQRWVTALREVALTAYRGRVVVFVDEIDAVRSLPFPTDEFFAAIRELYNRRSEDPALERLTFCLLGVAAPSDLVRDARTTPFNVGHRIELDDFTRADAEPLAAGLGRAPLLDRVLYWTGGHPYLTQRLCSEVAERADVAGAAGVDRVCEELFLSQTARERDDNLLFVRERLLRGGDADPASVLVLYRRVLGGGRPPYDETSPLVNALRLAGIVRIERGRLAVRNRIYARVFDKAWVAENMPEAEVRRQRTAFMRGIARTAAVATVVLALMGWLVADAWRQRARAEDLRSVAEERRGLLEHEQAINRKLLYTAHINLAYQAVGRGDYVRAMQLVDDEWPTGDAELQGFEYYYLWQQFRSSSVSMVTGATILDLAYSPDSRLLAAFMDNATLDVFDPATHDRLRHLDGLGSALTSGVFSPDGTMLVAACADGTVRSWDVATWTETAPTRANTDDAPLFSIGYADGGRTIVAGDVRGRLYAWNAATRHLVGTASTTMTQVVRIASNGPNGIVAAASADGQIVLWRPGAAHVTPLGQATQLSRGLVFLPGGETLVSACGDATITFWNVRGRKQSGPPLVAQSGLLCADVSRDGRRLAVGTIGSTVEVWDLATRTRERILAGHSKPVLGASFSSDGRSVASADSAGAVRVWDIARIAKDTLRGHEKEVYAVRFSPDGSRLASVGFDGKVVLWDPATGALVRELRGHAGFVRSVAFSPDGKRLVTGGDDATVRVWDAETGANTQTLGGHTERVFSVAFSPDGTTIASGAFDATVRVWDAATGAEKLRMKNPTGSVESVAFSPDGATVVSCGEGGPTIFWDARTGKEGATFGGHVDWTNALAFSPDGKILATSGSYYDATVRLWDVATGKQLFVLRGFGANTELFSKQVIGGIGRANCIAFSPDGRTLVLGTVDRSLKFFDVATGQELGALADAHDSEIYSVAFSPDGRTLATASADRTIKLWRAATAEDVHAAYR